MQVNTEVYGAVSTWRKDSDGWVVNNSVPYDYQFKLGQYDSLADYNTNSKIPIGTEIDKSICYAAHAEGMPLAKQSGFYIDEVSGEYVIKRFVRNKQTGFFFGHYTNSWLDNYDALQGAKAILNNITASLADLKTQYWIPDGVIASYPDQPSARVRPIVEFNTKGVYLAILVRVWNTANGTVQDYPLDSLYSGDWSNYRILQAWAEPWVYNTSDSSYTRATASSSNTCSVCPADLFQWQEYEGTTESIEYITYAPYFRQSRFPLYGWVHESVDTRYYRPLSMYRPLVRCIYNRDPAQSVGHIFIETIPTIFNSYSYTDWGAAIEGYAAINAANLEGIRKACAAYCLFFTEKAGSTLSGNADRWISNDMFCGVMDSNGVGHGEYTRGTGNRDNSVYGMGSSQNSPYTPGGGGGTDPNTYSNTTSFNSVSSNAALTKYYVLDAANVEKLGDDLWTICGELSADDFQDFDGKLKDEFLTTNPIDSIISLARFPFDIPHIFSVNKTPVQLGKSEGTAEGYRTYNVTFGVNFTGIDIYPRFGDCFLDYSPYTKYELYIPFCGTVEISPGDILGHKLNLQLLIDLITGSVVAYIMADQLVIGTAKGSCALDIQMSGMETATMKANIFNGIIQANLADTQEALNIGSMVWPTGAVKTLLDPFSSISRQESAEAQTQMANYSITHMIAPIHKMGSASPLLSWIQEFNARLMIFYPEGDVMTSEQPPSLIDSAVAAFGHMKGFATCTPGTVSDFRRSDIQCFTSGTIFADDIPCTSSERQRIISAFESGVYLPIIST